MPNSDEEESVDFNRLRKKNPGFFGSESSNFTFMKITGILALLAAITLIILLPVYFSVIELSNSSTDKPDFKTTSEPSTTVRSTTENLITSIPDIERFDCLPEENSTQQICEERGCTWSPIPGSDAPSCYYVGSSSYLKESETTNNAFGLTDTLRLAQNLAGVNNYYGEQYPYLTVQTTYISSSILRIKIYPDVERYEVPMDHMPNIPKPSNAIYSVEHVNEFGRFGVKVTRRLSSQVIFDTSVGELMFADQFLQISTRVASEYIYGFGEHMHESFKHDMNWKTYGMFSRDKGVEVGHNLYGVHPYFLCMEGNGNAYGVFFANSNAMDVTLQPTPAITYRSIGGLIDFYIFLGPSPEQVTQQYTEVIGRPYFPPYWSLGFQLCRWGYESIDQLKTVVVRNLAAGIPYDIQYSDIDYMERQMDFTIDNETYHGLEDFVATLKEEYKMRYIIILDPAITGNETVPYPPFDNGVRDDVFIKTPNGDIAWGKVWPLLPGVDFNASKDWDYQTEHYRALAAYPDFFLPNTSSWWTELTVDFYQRIQFDGLWIDMNEPSSFIDGSPSGCKEDSTYDHPPYFPHVTSDRLYDDTICMDNIQYHPKTMQRTSHYNLHSLYGFSETEPTLNACRASTGERCIVISRSTYPGSGKYSGHWLGDNTSNWEHLAASIIGMLEFNLFGIPYVGADVCGFWGESNYELCLRWMQLGAFYPFYRNHNSLGAIEQDPAYFGEEFIRGIKGTMETRYSLLPYLYTLFFDSHQTGSTVVRPLMNQFPEDNATYSVDRQFLWGPALLITPVLEPGKTSVTGYFPDGRWFDYYSGKEMQQRGGTMELDAPIDHINIHVLGGHIIPIQDPANNTFYSRKNMFGLLVALDDGGKANGKLFWDDGTSIDTIEKMDYTMVTFSCATNQINNKVIHTSESSDNMTLGSLRVVGISGIVTRVTVDGMQTTDFIYNEISKQMTITNLNLELTGEFEIRWEINNEWNRVDCMPSLSETPNTVKCRQRGCLWEPSNTRGVPSCFFDIEDSSKFPSYTLDKTTQKEGSLSYTLTRNRNVDKMYGNPVDKLQLDIEYQTSNRLHFKLKDPSTALFEVPEEILNLTSTIASNESDALYGITLTEIPFSLKISRKSTGKTIFDTSVGPLVFEDKFMMLSTILPSENVFGFGEHSHRRYRHDLNWKRWAIWARDAPPVGDWNFYGHHTFYMAIDDSENGTAIGVYLHNSNAMDVTLQPTPALTYRLTGGVLDFYIFIGETQEEVVQEYHKLIGFPAMVPYWGLGFQLSRWGYNSLETVRSVVNEMREEEIPFDVQYGDIDYMEEYKDFTYDHVNFAGLPEFVDDLHSWGMKYVIILDPGIKIENGYEPYHDALRENIFVMNEERTSPVVTKVWPGDTHHIDFTHPNTSNWWLRHCRNFHDVDGVQYDALWVDMNEPSNFLNVLPGNLARSNCSDEFNKPPFMPRILWPLNGLNDRTICMENKQYMGMHYNMHSLYGHAMAATTYTALEEIKPDSRSFVITRSTFAGTGKYAGHWLGDNQSLWPQMSWAISGMLEFNLFGIPYVGADVCGFMLDTTAELCQRWMQVGAFYPFSRNHNARGKMPQHPTAFGPDVTASSKKVLEIRYSILPYFYTLFHKVNHFGGTVVRALIHEFPSDKNTWNVDKQFLLGSGFLITPVMEEGARRVTGYLPMNARWFDFNTGDELLSRGRFVSLPCPLDHINIHVRGGTIIPMQNPAVTTELSRKNPMSILVALDDNEAAFGEMYWDNGEDRIVGEKYLAIHFTAANSTLTFTIHHEPLQFDVTDLYFANVTVLGIKNDVVSTVTVYEDSNEGSGSIGEEAEFTYSNRKLEITRLQLQIANSHVIQWA